MSRRTAACLWLLLLWLPGCTSYGPPSTYEEIGTDVNTKGFGRLYPQNPEEQEYVVGPGDVIAVQVEDVEELSAQQEVRQDGKITLPDPELQDILVAGLTTRQIADKLTLMLSAILTEAIVTVRVTKITSKKLFVVTQGQFGENIVGTRPYAGDTTLFDVISSVGGTGIFGDDCVVKVIRGDPRHPRVHTINVREMFMEGFTAGNIQMRPDDVVFIPPSLYGQMAQFIKRMTLPFEGLFAMTRAVYGVDRMVRIVEGDGFTGGYGFY